MFSDHSHDPLPRRRLGGDVFTGKALLALDFDGVLHPIDAGSDQMFCRLPLLEAWLHKNENVDVLISSGWRHLMRFEDLLGFFPSALRSRIVDVTPRLWRPLIPIDDYVWEFVRQREIELWVAASPSPNRPWIALDDDASLYEPTCQNLVVCDPKVGLNTETIEALSARLALH